MVDDLRATNPSSNEVLLAALADEFVKHNYDVKHLIRTIMNSAAYQRSPQATPENGTDDRFYSHLSGEADVRRGHARRPLAGDGGTNRVPRLSQRTAGACSFPTATSCRTS